MNNLDTKTLLKINPITFTLGGCALWLFLFAIAPLEIKVKLSIEGVFFLAFNLLFLVLGLKLFNSMAISNQENVIKPLLYRVTIILGLLCVLLKIYDKIFIRGGNFLEGFFENRSNFAENGSNAVAIIHSILTGFTFIPLFLYSYFGKRSKTLLLLSYLLFFSVALDIFLIGSRSGTILCFLIYIYYLYIFKKIKFTRINLVKYLAILLIGGIWMGVVFINRSKEFAGDGVVFYTLSTAGFTETIGPDESLINSLLNTDSEILQTIGLSYTTLINYYVHGIIEFLYIYDKFNSNHTLGSYTFYIYYKFINIIFGLGVPNFENIALVNPRPAVYTSFYGPIFFDFGWFSLIFSFLLGCGISYVHKKAVTHDFSYTIIYSYFINLIFFIPVFNFIEGAAGLYVVTSFLLFKLLTKII